MLSSMCPAFVYLGGRLWLVLGTPGGPTIFTTVFQVLVNKVDFGMSLADAVAAPRFHHQWPPPPGDEDPVAVERDRPLASEARAALVQKGYAIRMRDPLGDVHAIEIVGRKAVGVSDPRGVGGVATE
jgi:gamma-glutamyltranspeptidase/glutathione hydrolase